MNMHNFPKRSLALLLAVLLLFSLSACNAGLTEEYVDEETLNILCPINNAEDNPSFSDMVYVHYDFDKFFSFAEETKELIQTGDGGKVDEIAERIWVLNEAMYNVLDMQTYANISALLDVNDTYWSGEDIYINENLPLLYEAIGETYKIVSECKINKELAEAMEMSVEDMAEIAMSYLEPAAQDPKETELMYEHMALIENIYDPETGEEDIEVCREAAEVIKNIIKVRNESARKLGYANYVEMVFDDNSFMTSEDSLEKFCENLKACGDLYSDDLVLYSYADVDFEFFEEPELVAIIKSFLADVDSDMAEFFAELYDRGLFLLRPLGEGYNAGQTTYFNLYEVPVVYLVYEKNVDELTDSVHEYGHAYAYHIDFESDEDYGEYADDYALGEVQSTGLEALLCSKYDDIYKEWAAALKEEIGKTFYLNIVESLAFHEFEVWLYEHENFTMEEASDKYNTLLAEYGSAPNLYENAPWISTPHISSNPLYYYSYGLAYFASAQLLVEAENDFESAAEKYMTVENYGTLGAKNYEMVMEEIGNADICDEAAVREVLKGLGNYIRSNQS